MIYFFYLWLCYPGTQECIDIRSPPLYLTYSECIQVSGLYAAEYHPRREIRLGGCVRNSKGE